MLCCSLQFCNSTFKKCNPTSHIKLWFLKPKRTLKFYEKSAGSLKHGNGLFPCILKAINWQVFRVHREVSNNNKKNHYIMLWWKKSATIMLHFLMQHAYAFRVHAFLVHAYAFFFMPIHFYVTCLMHFLNIATFKANICLKKPIN